MTKLLLLLCLSVCVFSQCGPFLVSVNIIRYYNRTSKSESLVLSELNGDMTYQVDIMDGYEYDNTQVVYSYCLKRSMYSLEAQTTFYYGWYSNSRFLLYVEGNPILSDRLDIGNYKQWVFTTLSTVYQNSVYHQSFDSQLDVSWTSISFEESTWSDYNGGTTLFTSSITDYYRIKQSIPSNTNLSYPFKICVFTKYGFIAYLNGYKIFDHYMPSISKVESITYATNEDDAYGYHCVISLLNQYINNFEDLTTVVFAVEIHHINRPDHLPVLFNSYLYFYSTSSINHRNSAHVYSTSSYTSSNVQLAFDNDKLTSWNCYLDVDVCDFVISYNKNDNIFINRIVVLTNQYNNTDHYYVGVYGSNDGLTWILLRQHQLRPSASLTTIQILDLPNNHSTYSQYKLDFSENDPDTGRDLSTSTYHAVNKPLNIYEVIFITTSDVNSLHNLAYPSSIPHYINEPFFVCPFSSGYHDFSCDYTPVLPESIRLDKYSGCLYGVPTEPYHETIQIFSKSLLDVTSIANYSLEIIPFRMDKDVLLSFSLFTDMNHILSTYYILSNYENTPIFAIYTSHAVGSQYTITVPQGKYKFSVCHFDPNSWDSLTHIEVTFHINELNFTPMIGSYLDTSLQQIDFPFLSLLKYHDPLILCQLTDNFTQDWYSSTFQPSLNQWTYCMNNLNTSDSLYINTHVLLFRISFEHSIESNTPITYVLNIVSYQSLRLYMNSILIYNYYITDNYITTSSVSYSGDTSIVLHEIMIHPSVLHKGNNVICMAVLIPITIALPIHYDFNVILNPIYSNPFLSLLTEAIVESSYTDIDYPEYLLDGDYNTFWKYTFLNPMETYVTLYIAYKNERKYTFINYYCFVTSLYDELSDPSSWIFLGCVTESDCHVLSNPLNIHWTTRNQRRCFEATNGYAIYDLYKFIFYRSDIESLQMSISLAEIEFEVYKDDCTQSILPFSYPMSTVLTYKDMQMSPLFASKGYHGFFVFEYDLPAGIFMDSNDGTIYGIPTEYQVNSAVIIGAFNCNNTFVKTQLIFTINSCSFPNNLFSITYNTDDSLYNLYGYYLFSTLNSQNYANYTSIGPGSHGTHYYCLPILKYTIRLYDLGYIGWSNGTLSIYNNNNDHVHTFTHMSKPLETYIYENKHIYTEEDIHWYTYNKKSVVPPNYETWLQIDSDLSAWTELTHSEFGSPKSTSQYYRYLVQDSTLIQASALSLSFTYRCGIVIYVNGIIAYSDKMDLPVSPSAMVDECYSTRQKVIKKYLLYHSNTSVEGSNIINIQNDTLLICVEMHYSSYLPSYSDFSLVYNMTMDHEYLAIEGFATSINSKSKYVESIFDEGNLNIWENDICVGTEVLYTYYSNVQKFITSIEITNTLSCNNQHPSGFLLEGSNNQGISYAVIYQTDSMIFTSYNQTLKYSFIPREAYNSIRFTVTSCKNQFLSNDNETACASNNFHLSRIAYYADIISTICIPMNTNWSITLENSYSYRLCSGYYRGYESQICSMNTLQGDIMDRCQNGPPSLFFYEEYEYTFLVDRKITDLRPRINAYNLNYYIHDGVLPIGLYLDSNTGYISGIPLIHTSYTLVNLVAFNEYGSTSTSLRIIVLGTLSIYYCLPDSIWPQTHIYSNASLSCGETFSGNITRYCSLHSIPTWMQEINTCERIPYLAWIEYETDTFILPFNSTVNIVPNKSEKIDSYSINKNLPFGLVFINGTISGIPLAEMLPETYEITVVGTNTYKTHLFISVAKQFCYKNGSWPITEKGGIAHISCGSSYYTGYKTRACSDTNPPYWEDVVSTCVMNVPIIQYTYTRYTIDYNSYFTTNKPSCFGICTLWLCVSDLPESLTLNSTTGEIYGVVTTSQSDFIIVVSAFNENNHGTTSLTLNVLFPVCEEDGEWIETKKGSQIVLPCNSTDFEGEIVRECSNDHDPYWKDPVINCYLKAPKIWYNQTEYVFFKSVRIQPLQPFTQYRVTKYSFFPYVPLGLVFDSETGVLSGIPISTYSRMEYHIMASNEEKQSSVVIYITIILAYCPLDKEWLITSLNSSQYLLCESLNEYGFMSRACITDNTTVFWDDVNKIDCNSNTQYDSPNSANFMNLYIVFIVDGDTESLLTGFVFYLIQYLFFIKYQDAVETIHSIRFYPYKLISSTQIQYTIKILSYLNSDIDSEQLNTYISTTFCDRLKNNVQSVETCTFLPSEYKIIHYVDYSLVISLSIVGCVFFIFLLLVLYFFHLKKKNNSIRRYKQQKNTGYMVDNNGDRDTLLFAVPL